MSRRKENTKIFAGGKKQENISRREKNRKI